VYLSPFPLDIAANAGNGTISDISIDGHANAETQTFGLTDADAAGTTSQLHISGSGNHVYLQTDANTKLGLLSTILKNKLSPNALIRFGGCDTASGSDNIAQATSQDLNAKTIGAPYLVKPVLFLPDLSEYGYWNNYSNGVWTGITIF
jgi:hypothetical protein